MNRRHLVIAGATAFAAAPVLAYAQGAPAAMSKAETDHMERTMKTGALALVTSRIAMQKAQSPRVKQFAQFEIAEQETIADILKSMQNPANVSGDIKSPADAEVRAQLDAKGKDMVTKLEGAKDPAEFEREYIKGQIAGHKELLDAQEDYLKAGKNAAAVNVAKLARGQIKEHLVLLQDIEKDLGRKS